MSSESTSGGKNTGDNGGNSQTGKAEKKEIKFEAVLNPDGSVTVGGPIKNFALSMFVLNKAQEAIIDMHVKQNMGEQGRILYPNYGIMP